MTSLRLRSSFVIAALAVLAAAACSSTTIITSANGADGGAGTDSGSGLGSDSGSAPPLTDSGSSNKPDASKDSGTSSADSGPQLNGWTPEGSSLLYTYLEPVTGLIVDPVTPRHFLITLQSNTSLAFEWKNGVPAQPLIAAFGDPTAEYNMIGGGFDGNGGIYAYYDGFPGSETQTPFKLAISTTSGTWSWLDMPPPFDYASWPPTNMAVGEGSPATEMLFSNSRVWNITGKTSITQTMSWPNWDESTLTPAAEGGFGRVAFVPGDSTTFLATMSASPVVHRCTFAAALTCDTSQTTGIPAAESLAGIAIASSDPNRVHVLGGDAGSHIFASSDGGVSFTEVPLPTWPAGFSGWAVSPTAPDTIALYLPSYEISEGKDALDELVFTKDGGTTWTQIQFPDTETTDVDAFVFDAAGTLFMSRSSTLFSRVL